MFITNEKRKEQMQTCSEEILNLFGSMELTAVLKKVSTQYQIEKQQVFVQTVGDVILGFYKMADLPSLLQRNVQMSADEAQRATSTLIEVMTPVIKREGNEQTQKKTEIQNLANNFAQKSQVVKAEPAPVATQQFAAVEPIKTMEDDMNRAHGYGALREIINSEPESTPPKPISTPSETSPSIPPKPASTQGTEASQIPIKNNINWTRD